MIWLIINIFYYHSLHCIELRRNVRFARRTNISSHMMELLSLDISVHLCPYDYIMTLSILVMRMVCTLCWGQSTRTALPTSAASGRGTSLWPSATGWSLSWTSPRWGTWTEVSGFSLIIASQVALHLFQAGANIVKLGIMKPNGTSHDIISYVQGQNHDRNIIGAF